MADVLYYSIGTAPSSVSTSQLTDDGNPLFNFDQDFVDGLQTITPIDLATAVPYVSLSLLTSGGEEVNLNLLFFHNLPDKNDLATAEYRHADRPPLSLRKVELKQTQASGYLYYTEVRVDLKIHRPDFVGNSVLMALLFPGMPLKLEYGWNTNNDDSPLDVREGLVFSVKNYNITYDEIGQADLSIEGLAFNDVFNNILVGDTGQDTEDADGVKKYSDKLNKYNDFVVSLLQSQEANVSQTDVLVATAEPGGGQTREQKSRGAIREGLKSAFEDLGKDENRESTRFTGHAKAVQTVKLHKIIATTIEGSLAALADAIPGLDEIRFVYGTFNERAGDFGNTSVADFPVDWKKFLSEVDELLKNGGGITLRQVLNILSRAFLANGEYFSGSTKKKDELQSKDVIKVPNPAVMFTTREQGTNKYAEVYFIDASFGIPSTTQEIKESSDTTGSKSTQAETEQTVVGDTGIPKITLGHANAFVKKISLGHIVDANMKASLIAKIYQDRVPTVRDPDTEATTQTVGDFLTPLTLPLKGSATVIGHPEWKPFRAFYLDSGIFLLDAVYIIRSVTHTLSSEGFSTEIDFIYT